MHGDPDGGEHPEEVDPGVLLAQHLEVAHGGAVEEGVRGNRVLVRACVVIPAIAFVCFQS